MKINKELMIGIAIGTSFGIVKAVANAHLLKKQLAEIRGLEAKANEEFNNFATSVNEDLVNERFEKIKKELESKKESEKELWDEFYEMRKNGEHDPALVLRLSRELL